MTALARPLLLSAIIVGATACSEDDPSPSPIGADADAAEVASEVAIDAVSESAVDSFVPTDAGPEIKGTTIDLGGFSVPAGGEVTKCGVLPLGEIEPRFLRLARLQLDTAVYEVAVYRDVGPTKPPADCEMFSGLSSSGRLMLLGHAPDATLTFPDTSAGPVGMTLAVGGFLRVEVHALNASSAPVIARATLNLGTTAVPTNAIEGATMLSTNTAISIPATGTAAAERFNPGVASTSVFATVMHTHALGTAAEARFGASATDSSATTVYTTATPSQGPLTTLSPPLAMPPGTGTASAKGLAYKCTYTNTGATTVTFGNGWNDEQCMLLSWYYPSSGFQLCIDGACTSKL